MYVSIGPSKCIYCVLVKVMSGKQCCAKCVISLACTYNPRWSANSPRKGSVIRSYHITMLSRIAFPSPVPTVQQPHTAPRRQRYIPEHYNYVIMGEMASQITSLTIVYWTVYSGVDQRKHQSPASLAFVRGIHRWPVISPHKGPVTRKMFPFDDVIMRHADRVAFQSHNQGY